MSTVKTDNVVGSFTPLPVVNGANAVETYVATSGQTVFTTTKFNNSVMIKAFAKVGSSFTELTSVWTGTNTVSVSGVALTSGQKVYIYSVADATLRQDLSSIDGAKMVGIDYVQPPTKDTVSSVLTTLANTPDWYSRRVMDPIFTDDTGGAEIYTGAGRAVQGLVILDTPGGTKLYMISRPVGDNNAIDERCRIVEFNYDVSTGRATHVQYSPLLAVGHGEALGGRVDGDGQVWLYTTQSNLDGTFVGANARKGFSRIQYKGVTTSQADVTSYNLFGLAGSTHEQQEYVNGSVGLSSDGSKVLIVADSTRELGSPTLFVYDRAEVEAATTPLNVRPIKKFRINSGTSEGYGRVGVAADDQGIYVIFGTSPFSDHGVVVYDWSGRFIKDVPIDDVRGEYTYDQLMGGGNNVPAVFELEGAALYQNKLHFVVLEAWRTVGDVVSFAHNDTTANFACIQSRVTGIYPYDHSYWVPTKLAATVGAFNPATTYNRGSALTTYRKRVYAIAPFKGDGYAQANGRFLQRSSSMLNTGRNNFNALTYNYPGILRFMGWNENTKTIKRTMEYNSGYLRMWDTTELGDFARYGSVRAKFQGSAGLVSVQAYGGSEAAGARTVWFAGTDTELPGGIKELVGGSESVIVRQVTTAGEHTLRNLTTVPAVMNLQRVGGSGEILKFQLSSPGVTYGSIASSTSNLQIVAKSGVDLCLSTAADDSTSYQPRWRVNGTDFSFRPGSDNVYSIGVASARPSVIWAGTGTISTSDGRKKTSVRQLSSNEIAAAKALSDEIGIYQWLDTVEQKGDAARLHVGMTVQRAIEVMTSHNLDPLRYGFICHDVWEAQPEVIDSWDDEYDDEGNLITAAGSEVVKEATEAGDLYSFRSDELYAFIAAGQRARLESMEQRLAALEA